MTEQTGAMEPVTTTWVVPPEWPKTAARSYGRELMRRPGVKLGLVVAIAVILGLFWLLAWAIGASWISVVVGALVGIPLAFLTPAIRNGRATRELARRQPPGSQLVLVEDAHGLELRDATGSHLFPYSELVAVWFGEHLAVLAHRSLGKGLATIPMPLLSPESVDRVSAAVRGR